jgi:hypothetical protein
MERVVTSEVHYSDEEFGDNSNDSGGHVLNREPDEYLDGIPLYLSRYRLVFPKADQTEASSSTAASESGDSDGSGSDEPVRRRRPKRKSVDVASSLTSRRYTEQHLTIYHSKETTIAAVGLQLWKASFLLADYLIHQFTGRRALEPKRARPSQFDGGCIIELGCGCGFIGAVLAHLLQSPCPAFITDYTADILKVAKRNLQANDHLTALGGSYATHDTDKMPRCRILDWNEKDLFIRTDKPSVCNSFSSAVSLAEDLFLFSDGDLQQIMISKQLMLVGADIVYDNELTIKFLETSARILLRHHHSSSQALADLNGSGYKLPTGVLIVALEKRFNFELESQSVAAHGYKTFLQFINADNTVDASQDVAMTCSTDDEKGRYYWKGCLANMLFPQYFMDYERTEYLELWQLELFAV